MSVDHVTFNILTNSYIAISQEMSADLLRTAYSTVIREAADASTFLADRQGRILAQSQNIPLHMNSVSPAIQGALERIDVAGLTEDDVIILNDPYSGGQHQSDVYLFSPILWDTQLVGFSGSVGHYADLGHSLGFNLHAIDIFEERMRFTPIKFSLSQHWNGGILEQLIRANVRMPAETIGDMNAQLTANETGRRRFKELIQRHGVESVLATAEQFLDYCEEHMRRAISGLPDGVYTGMDVSDGDGITDQPIEVHVSITVRGSDLLVDFTGTSPQVKTAINCPWASTIAATYPALKMMLTDAWVPINDGSYRPVRIFAPKGCILNPREYAPVEGRNVMVMRVFQAIQKALAKALPDRISAPGFDTRTEVDLHWHGDRFYAVNDPLGGGYGAGPHNDGADQLDDPLGNCKNTPVEAMEMSQPFFRISRYELIPDSGGAGRSRGGLGAIRTYDILEDGVHLTVYSDHFRYPAAGFQGGHDGTCGSITIVRSDGRTESMGPKGHKGLNRGDRLEVRIGGGAGFGDPRLRDRKWVYLDVRSGRVSPEAARTIYGWSDT